MSKLKICWHDLSSWLALATSEDAKTAKTVLKSAVKCVAEAVGTTANHVLELEYLVESLQQQVEELKSHLNDIERRQENDQQRKSYRRH